MIAKVSMAQRSGFQAEMALKKAYNKPTAFFPRLNQRDRPREIQTERTPPFKLVCALNATSMLKSIQRSLIHREDSFHRRVWRHTFLLRSLAATIVGGHCTGALSNTTGLRMDRRQAMSRRAQTNIDPPSCTTPPQQAANSCR